MVIDKYLLNEDNGDLVSGPNRVVDFVNCLFTNQDSYSNQIDLLEICSNENLKAGEYETLIYSVRKNLPEVLDVFKKVQDETEKLAPLSRLPTITLNGEVSVNAFNDLIEEVCDKYNVS